MLVISRKENERVKIGEKIEIIIVSIDKNQVKIGIEAPKNLTILRGELIDKVRNENIKAAKQQIDIQEIKKVFNEN